MLYDEPECNKFLAILIKIKQLRRRTVRRERALRQRLKAIVRKQRSDPSIVH